MQLLHRAVQLAGITGELAEVLGDEGSGAAVGDVVEQIEDLRQLPSSSASDGIRTGP